MKLGFLLGYSGKQIHIPIDLIKQAESMGYDSVWTAEAYGNDAVTSASWVLAQTEKIRVGTAIMQMPARTPAMAAMTAMSLNQLSGGRFIVGLGASGPQVVEGWHGVPYGKPVTRTKEYIQIMRRIMEREGPVEFDGQIYQMPVTGEGTTGLGKPLKSILEGAPDIPIYTASITPAGLRCAGEVADGVFPVWMDPDKYDILGEHIEAGFARAAIYPADGLIIDFAIEFPDPAIGHQRRVLDMRNGAFVRELCDSRTFCRKADVEAMHAQGLALGGSLGACELAPSPVGGEPIRSQTEGV